jgi:hypothetical protein
MDWEKFTQGLLNVVQVLGILVGGGFVYFKFIRGRTFARRGELNLDATVIAVGKRPVIRVALTFKNTGLSLIRFEPDAKVVYLEATSTADWSPGGNFHWQDVMTTPVFEEQK